MSRARFIFQSSVIVIIFFGLGKVTGLLRGRLVAQVFGTGAAYDAFTSANQLPEVFVTLLAGGALAAAFIPVYSTYLTDDRKREGLRVANTTLTLVFLLLASVSIIGALLSPWLVSQLLVPNFSASQQALTATLMRIILVQTTLFGISGVISSILNAHQHFALPAFAPVMLDIGYVVGLYLFVPTMGIQGLAWGTVVGGLLHIAIQVPALIRHRFRFRPRLDIQLSGVREIVRLMGPRIVTLGAIQIADLFIIRLTSNLPEGSTAGYFYGYNLQQLPETLLGTAIAIVFFPTMAELFNKGDIEGMKRTAMSALGIIWTLTIPAAFALVLLGREGITLFFEQGEFDARSTALVYGILIFFSVRVVSEATLEIVARLFYAQHDTRTPMAAYVGWLVVNVALMYLLVGSMGAAGLALASTIAFTLLSAVLFILNRRRLGSLYERELLVTAGRSLAGSLVMTGVILLVETWITSTLLYFLVAAAAGGLVYLATITLLRGREIAGLIRLLLPERASN